MGLHPFQLDETQKEANDGCGAGVFETRKSMEKWLQLRQRHNELGDVIIVGLEDVLFNVLYAVTTDLYI